MTVSKKRIAIILGILQAFIGIGAVPSGVLVLMDPNGSMMGVTTELLEGSPFKDFLIPGLFLLLVNGVGSLVGAFLSFKRHPFAGKAGMGLGFLLIMWIIIQVITIGPPINAYQIVYFIFGVVELVLGWKINARVD